MLELKLYRHKKYKDIYLLRIPGYTDKNHKRHYYDSTENLFDALQSYKMYGDKFLICVDDDANKSVDVWLTKYVEDEGYKGALEKEEELLISDFELVVLREVVEGE